MLDGLSRELDDMVMAVGAFVDATTPLLSSSGPWGDYGDLGPDDLYYYQERVANLDKWVADGRDLAAAIAELDRRISEAVGAWSSALTNGQPGADASFAEARDLQGAAADLGVTLADYLEELRLVYGAAVSDADRVAASLAGRSRQRSATLHTLRVV